MDCERHRLGFYSTTRLAIRAGTSDLSLGQSLVLLRHFVRRRGPQTSIHGQLWHRADSRATSRAPSVCLSPPTGHMANAHVAGLVQSPPTALAVLTNHDRHVRAFKRR